MLHVVCVDHGNYLGRGGEYVTNLFNGVCRNLQPPFKFTCFTDRPNAEGVYPAGINLKPTPAGVTGWYNKLYLFKPGLFPKDERILFLDLDTVIVGSLEPLREYEGEFAILRDFLKPTRWGPGIMLWSAGVWEEIWTAWERDGRPHMDLGDLTWINRLFKVSGYVPDALQDITDGICSYKLHGKIRLPDNTRIVCFHGKPRPHEVTDRHWMRMYWNGKRKT